MASACWHDLRQNKFGRFQLKTILLHRKTCRHASKISLLTYNEILILVGQPSVPSVADVDLWITDAFQFNLSSVPKMDAIQQSWTSFKGTVRSFDTPHQLGLGLAFGVAVGLIPKDSLLPYVIGGIAILSTANLLCFGIGVVVAHVASPTLDHITHEIGSWFLTFRPLEPIWATLSEFPLVAWTRFNNSVVMGTLILGILLAVPIYTMTRMVSRSVSRRFVSRRERHATDSPSTVTTQV